MTPVRIQLSRRKGWKMPANTVKVDRTTKWENPFVIGPLQSAADCVTRYRQKIAGNRWSFPTTRDIENELKGKNIACWCQLCAAHSQGKPFGEQCAECAPCHADVLIELANPEPSP